MLIKVDNIYLETVNISHIIDLRESNSQVTQDSLVEGAQTRIVMNSKLYLDTSTPVEKILSPHELCPGIFNYTAGEFVR